jgi:hypothetical protein
VTPPNSTALVFLKREGQPFEFLGTACAYRSGQHYLTAAHCVRELEPEALCLIAPGEAELVWVESVATHPTADIALLIAKKDAPAAEPFWMTMGEIDLGEQFTAFGYPEDVVGRTPMPTPRCFVGHFQRFFSHESFMGYRYRAAELSISAPRGLSGGPVFRSGAQYVLHGVVAENVESATAKEAHEEEVRPGEKREIRVERVISYGVAVLVHPLAQWLDPQVPSIAEAQERGR